LDKRYQQCSFASLNQQVGKTLILVQSVICKTMNKQTILAAVNALPEEIELDELVEHLVLIQKLEKGREQSRNNQTVSQEEVKQLVKAWFK
jgi:parvulin-like peptidyl-prolyl isomerase